MGRLGLTLAGVAGALALGAATAHAQDGAPPPSTFAGPLSFPTTDSQHAVLADFNHDGRLDVATADSQPAVASVLLGRGDATFGATQTYSLAGHPHDIVAVNLNGNTALDLAISEQETGNVTLLSGVGDGTFVAAGDAPAAGNAYALAAGDVNGDAKQDLVVSDSNNATVKALLGDGNGGFSAAAPASLPSNATDIAITDMNNDTRPDLVVSSTNGGSGSVSVLLGAGDGTFAPFTTVGLPGAGTSIVSADFSEDGNPDVAVGIDSLGVGLLDGNGQGGTRGFLSVEQLNGAAVPTDLATGDFEGDGHIDIAATGGPLVTLSNYGPGDQGASAQSVFRPAVVHGGSGVGLAVGDLNSDLKPDAVLASNDDVQVFANAIASPPLPPPTVARTANVAPVKGTILVKQPGSRKFIRLEEGAQVRVGSELDATKGTVRLTSAAGGGKTQSGLFNGGIFKIGQKKGKHPFTELKLTQQLRCVTSHKPLAGTAAKRPRSRRLFGNAHGRFRTRGRHSVATIRGTKWLVKDTCKTTLTRSIRGTVVVRDLVKHRTVTLKSGQRYLARRGNR